MIGLFVYFFFGLLFLLTAVIVFFQAKEKAFYFFAGYIIINGLAIVSRSLEFNGLFTSFPHLYGILHPLQYLYGPFYLFFLVKVFNSNVFIRKREFFHLIPFLLAFIDTIPFYALPVSEKIAIIQAKESISYFGITKELNNALKGASFILYNFWCIGYYLFYLYTSRISNDQQTRITHYWFRIDLMLKVIAVFSFVYFQVIKKQHSYTLGFYLLSLDSLFNVLVIYFKPSLLNGLGVEKSRNELRLRYSFYYLYRALRVLLNFSASDKDVLNYLKYSFKVRQIHLNPATNVNLISRKLSIRPHKLNEISMNKFGCTINEFINYKRLEVFVEDYAGTDDISGMVPTIFKCGFNSIIDFQTCMEHYSTYPNKEFLNVTPDSIFRLQEIMKQTISKN